MNVTSPINRPRVDQHPELTRTRDLQSIRGRKVSEHAREIGDIPEPINVDMRRASRDSLKLFCEFFHPQTFCMNWSDDHLELIARIEEVVLRGGMSAVSFPRGHGKTSLCIAACEWGLLHSFTEFVVLIGSDANAANLLLRSIKTDFETNDRIHESWPEVTVPVRALDGLQMRTRGQLHRGQRTRSEWSPRVVVLPSVQPGWDPELYGDFLREDGFAHCSGRILRTSGLTGGLRGMVHKKGSGETTRPDLVVVDDPQNDSSAASGAQTDKRLRLITGSVMGLGGPGKRISCIMPLTCIRVEDLADRVLNRRLHPEWNGIRKPLVRAWPVANDTLWEEYLQIRTEDQEMGLGPLRANQFYWDNFAAMNEGAEVSWPERYNDDELSAIQHAYNLKKDRGDIAFASEYQSQPLSELDANPDDISPEFLMNKLSKFPRNIAPLDVEYVCAGVDVMANLLFYVVCGFSKNFTGHVLDWGSFPEQKKLYYTLENAPKKIADVIPAPDLDGRLFGALSALVGRIMTNDYVRDDGIILKCTRLLVDSGWGLSTAVVHRYIRQCGFAGVMASHGRYIGAAMRPISEWQTRPGERKGPGYRIRAVDGRKTRSCVFDSNLMKSFTFQRLRLPLGSRSSLDLFGERPEQHRLFVDHVLKSEYRVQMTNKTDGRSTEEWKERPERSPNHLWDSLVLCHLGMSIEGGVLDVGHEVIPEKRKVSFRGIVEGKGQGPAPAPGPGKPKKVSFRELRVKNQQPRP